VSAVSTAVHEFLAAGVAMIPIPLGEKGPRTKNWQRREQAVFGEENAHRFAGINAGLAHEWSRTCAIDIDSFDDADAWLTSRGVNLEQLFCVEDAVSVSSGLRNRGKLLFRLPEGASPPTTCKVKADDDRVVLEFRCAGSQDVIAGKHPSGTDYSVIGDPSSMPTLPDRLWTIWKELLQPRARSSEKRANGSARFASGGRNEALTREAGKLRRLGLSTDTISAALQQVNLERCEPPLAPPGSHHDRQQHRPLCASTRRHR
jgi:Bifunctional DNA primase/polymerase, N-terminal/Primase C terminal 1 (PriCT-1)